MFDAETNFRSYSIEYQHTFKWTIDNLSKLPEEWIEKSPEFTIEPQSKWQVEFKKNMNIFFLFLCWNSEKRFRNSYTALVSDSSLDLATYEGSCSGDRIDLTTNDFYSSVIKKVSTDKLVFTISLKVWYFQSDTLQTSISSEGHLHTLRDDLKKMNTNNIRPDVTLNVKGETLSAHRAVLMARSEVFARMFQDGMKEEQTDTVSIVDVSVTAMRALLSFMYSAEVADLDLDTALEVYAAADKYAIFELVGMCRRLIASKVSMESTTKVLVFSEVHDDPVMKDSIMLYISHHYKSEAS